MIVLHFRDVFSLLQQPAAFKVLMELLVERAKAIQPPIEVVIGLDSRGFLFAPMIALELNVPFVAVRKKGKLPGAVKKVTYDLEYGQVGLQGGVFAARPLTSLFLRTRWRFRSLPSNKARGCSLWTTSSPLEVRLNTQKLLFEGTLYIVLTTVYY